VDFYSKLNIGKARKFIVIKKNISQEIKEAKEIEKIVENQKNTAQKDEKKKVTCESKRIKTKKIFPGK